jgi:hypothetical protein
MKGLPMQDTPEHPIDAMIDYVHELGKRFEEMPDCPERYRLARRIFRLFDMVQVWMKEIHKTPTN